MKGNSILLTGAAGFIGSHTADKLLARGDKVIAVDNFNDYYDPALKEANVAPHAHNKNYVLHRIDFSDFEAISSVFEEHKIDKIIHLGARAGVRPSIANAHIYEQTNIKGTLNLLELARKHQIKTVVMASSSSVYGERKDYPFKETDNVDHPISPYAATKKATELFGYTYHYLHGMNIACLRFFTVYGPRGRPDMIPMMFMKKILAGEPIDQFGDGSSMRDYTYVDDIVSGVIASCDTIKGYEIFNLGNDSPVKLSEFISTLEHVLGKKAQINIKPPFAGDVPLTYADITKARKMLNYDPKTKIDQGLKNMYEWYKTRQ